MKNSFYRSRLFKKQEAKSLRLAIIFIILSLSLIFGIIFFGPTALIKLSLFLVDIRSSSQAPPQEDKIPPAPPQLIIPFEATPSATIKLSGFAEPGVKVEIFINGLSKETVVVDNDGNFQLSNLEITSGENEIYAIATDNAGNVSQPSPKITVIFDNTPPKLEITQPEDKATFYGISKTIEIKGEAEEDASVSVNDHLATMEAGGKFRYSLTLAPGVNNVKIVATDKAGNQTEKNLTFFLE
jgi:hypothetical protein